MRGFIIDEGACESGLWLDLPAFRLLIHLFRKAVFQNPVNYGGIVLQPGQYLRSYRGIQEELPYLEHGTIKTHSLAGIKRAVDRLVAEQRISIEESKFGTIFTVLNYELYPVFSGYPHSDGRQAEKSVGSLSYKPEATTQQAQQTFPLDALTESKPSGDKSSTGTDSIWGDGLRLLLEAGVKEPNARSFLGRALKQYGEEALDEAVSAALLNDPADPKSYLMGCLKKQRDEKDREAEERRYMTPGERRTQEFIDDFMRTYRCGN